MPGNRSPTGRKGSKRGETVLRYQAVPASPDPRARKDGHALAPVKEKGSKDVSSVPVEALLATAPLPLAVTPDTAEPVAEPDRPLPLPLASFARALALAAAWRVVRAFCNSSWRWQLLCVPVTQMGRQPAGRTEPLRRSHL